VVRRWVVLLLAVLAGAEHGPAAPPLLAAVARRRQRGDSRTEGTGRSGARGSGGRASGGAAIGRDGPRSDREAEALRVRSPGKDWISGWLVASQFGLCSALGREKLKSHD